MIREDPLAPAWNKRMTSLLPSKFLSIIFQQASWTYSSWSFDCTYCDLDALRLLRGLFECFLILRQTRPRPWATRFRWRSSWVCMYTILCTVAVRLPSSLGYVHWFYRRILQYVRSNSLTACSLFEVAFTDSLRSPNSCKRDIELKGVRLWTKVPSMS